MLWENRILLPLTLNSSKEGLGTDEEGAQKVVQC